MNNRHLYPKNWEAISLSVRKQAVWCCEECGRPCRKPDEDRHEFEARLHNGWEMELYDEVYDKETGEWGYVEKFGRFCLTVAHLDHHPANCDRANLKALCAPCHLRYDAPHHARNAAKTRAAKADARAVEIGQLSLNLPS